MWNLFFFNLMYSNLKKFPDKSYFILRLKKFVSGLNTHLL